MQFVIDVTNGKADVTRNKVLVGLGGAAVGTAVILALTSPASTTPTVEGNIAAYEQLVADVYGTAADRRAGDRIVHYKMQQAIRSCMKGQGFDYRPPAYSGVAGGPVSPGDHEVGTPLTADFGLATGLQQHASGIEADAKAGGNKPGLDAQQGPDRGLAYTTAMNGCVPVAAPFQDDSIPADHEPVAQELEDALRELQGSEDADPLLADYRQCLSSAGYPGIASRADLYALVDAAFGPLREKSWSQVSADPQWAEAVAVEKAAATADRACRTKLYHWAVGKLRPTVDRLTGDARVARLKTDWAGLRTQAADLK